MNQSKMSKRLWVFFLGILMVNIAVFGEDGSRLPEQIDQLMSKYHEYKMFNGSVLVARDGKVIFKKGYGMANMEWDIPNTPDTRFRLGSITKQFTSMLIMQLVEKGKIMLEGKLSEYLPYYREDTGKKITIHHLLTHTSGIPSYTGRKDFEKISRVYFPVKEFVETYCSGDLEFEPGSTYKYNNSGYYILGAVIEEVTGKTYEKNLDEKIFKPLGMDHSGYDRHSPVIPKRASGYEKGSNGFRNADFLDMGNPFAAGSLYSTVEDLYKWDQALYTEKLLSKKYMDMIFTQHVKMGQGTNFYGYGWMVIKTPFGQTILTHGGGINGFNTLISRIKENRHLVVLLNNTGGTRLGQMAQGISMMLYGMPPQVPKRPIADDLFIIIKEKGVALAVARYREWKKEEKSDRDFSEAQLNNLGYMLIRDRLDDAIEIFKLNVEMFPGSSNPYDSLGEAYMKKGNRKLAIKNYQKSYDLNPKNTNALDMIKKLKKK